MPDFPRLSWEHNNISDLTSSPPSLLDEVEPRTLEGDDEETWAFREVFLIPGKQNLLISICKPPLFPLSEAPPGLLLRLVLAALGVCTCEHPNL